ncbi:MAG: ribonuclease D [Limnoraphis robusta]|uniref:3'-5' exonuclease n=1 Tax=Limnoraphis robusta CS-951 TaxID=1637645 RepID=A0A0F5YFN1_9CYAN|nr:3'-5' exonuclease [Limnoraphis robusta]KKD37709.1 3'-5' exonuclease [Limnoraphis robusta CS-951]MEA5540815.1 ribonuclease D [Limnoraphis robusta Tam1]
MPYLTDTEQIKAVINQLSSAQILWIDTEVADYKSQPRLSLIQVLTTVNDQTDDHFYLLDVLDKTELISHFIDVIMINPAIEKVFHNANYDLKLLGKKQAKNVTCTLEIAKKIPYYLLPVPNYQLKTLATTLGNFSNIDKQEQSSDWGQRPLSKKQLEYAKMDLVYLANIHQHLLQLQAKSSPDPTTENLDTLATRYQEIAEEWKLLDSEITHIQERLKQAMKTQQIAETDSFKLTSSQRKTLKTSLTELSELIQTQNLDFDFPITLTQDLQKQLGKTLEKLPTQEEQTTIWRLIPKSKE